MVLIFSHIDLPLDIIPASFWSSSSLQQLHYQRLMEKVNELVSQKPVVVFSLSSCCMSYTVKSLFLDLGVNADVHELDEEPHGREIQKALSKLVGRNPPVPVVFIGGRLVGSTDRVMSLHLGGHLVQLLTDAGALWL
ncbi:putative glutaredoxin-C14 [Platanthera guangdongensis]|uniref:Glutaredoxin-C14 n=1 Tax=Platanthera guangdongensis TaxID=2320717 RepID=A0ABR2MNH5_9ASPA